MIFAAAGNRDHARIPSRHTLLNSHAPETSKLRLEHVFGSDVSRIPISTVNILIYFSNDKKKSRMLFSRDFCLFLLNFVGKQCLLNVTLVSPLFILFLYFFIFHFHWHLNDAQDCAESQRNDVPSFIIYIFFFPKIALLVQQ